jgi:hypothetical protein
MRSAVTSACLVLVLALAGTAAAQPALTPPTPLPAAQPSGDELSENTALLWSLGGTAVSWGLVAASAGAGQQSETVRALAVVGGIGTMFAPSFGHWYAHDALTRGLGLRWLGGGVVVAAAVVAFSECPLFSGEDCHPSAAAPLLAIAGGGLFIGGTIDDIVTAPGAVRRRNQRLHDVAIVPMIRRDHGGVMVSGRF